MLSPKLPGINFLRQIPIILLVACMTILSSCEDEEQIIKQDDAVPKDIVTKLQEAGFNTSEGLFKTSDGYVVEYDLHFTEEMLDRLLQNEKTSKGGRTKHFRTTNLVTGTDRVINVFMAADFNQHMQNAMDAALQRYNNLFIRLIFRRTTIEAAADIRIVLGETGGLLAFSWFPTATGDPHNLITFDINTFGPATNRGDATSLVAHEIGHAIGFRHTDHMDRFFSCNEGGAEPDGGVGIIHIPGTPTGPVGGSWMLACTSGSDRPFIGSDIDALRELYGGTLNIYDLTSYSDLIEPLDFDGDGDDDLMVYRPGSRIFYLFEYREGRYDVVSYGSGGFLNYDLSSPYDRAIKLDYNGDGFDDLLLYRPGSRISYIMRSEGNGNFTNIYVSGAGFMSYDLNSLADKIISTDYNNDGRDDVVCYRPGSRIVQVYRSNGTSSLFSRVVSSSSGIGTYDLNDSRDQIISLDYNGDGLDDLACYRPGARIFYLLRSNGNATYTRVIGSGSGVAGYDLSSSSDRMIRLNIDGDAFDDIAAYRPGSRIFYLLRSNGSGFSATITSGSGIMGYDFNEFSDKAVAPDYNADGRSDLLCYRPGRGTLYYGRSTGSNFILEFSK